MGISARVYGKMPDKEIVPPEQYQEDKGDLLEQLLVVAAEKAAKQEADNALKKGFVTREQINAAFTQFGENMETSLVEKITEMLVPQIQDAVQKAGAAQAKEAGTRKGTIPTPEDERDADPIAYLLKKGKELGPEAYDDVDKRIIWAITYKGLSQGLTLSDTEEE